VSIEENQVRQCIDHENARNPKEAEAPLGCSLRPLGPFSLWFRCVPSSLSAFRFAWMWIETRTLLMYLVDRSRAGRGLGPSTPEGASQGPGSSPNRLPAVTPTASGFPLALAPELPRLRAAQGFPLAVLLNLARFLMLGKPDRWFVFASHDEFSRSS